MANPLDRDETPARGRSGGLREIEGIAIESGLPANLLLAVAENAPDADGALGLAREMAAAYSPRIRAGEDIQAILRAEAPDHADAIIGRARQIGEQIYPEQMRAAREAAERAAQERRANEPGVLGDFRRAMTAGAVEGIGSVVEGAGILADQPLSLLRDSEVYEPGMLARGGAAVGDAARRMAEGLRGGMSEDSRLAMADSTPDGDLFDPSTWSAGDDPSPRGYLMHFGSTLGSLVPVIATGVAGRVAAVGGRATAMAAGAVGGAQAAGDGAGTAAGLIEEAFQRRGEDGRSELEAASPLFQELRAQGRSEEEAFAAVRDEAARFGAMLQAPIGAVSGSFMGAAARGLNPVINRMPGGPLSRAMRAGLATAFEEGASEAAEGAAARFGAQVASGMDVNETEGTFGDFVLGAMGGGPVGAIAGAAPGAERRAGGGDDDERGTGSGVVVSPEPAAPGGSGEGVASTPIAEPAAGRDEQRLARVRVQLRGERQAWDGEIIGETGDMVQIRAADGQVYDVPRAEIESGDVILTALEGGGPPPARIDTPPPPAADRPAEDFGIGGEPEAEQADSQPMTTDDARRLLDAIEARARRQGWDDEMIAAAAQLKDAIERGTPADPAIARSEAVQIGRSNGAPFGDEASARRALGKLGISAGGYDVVLTEGGYVARPKLDLRDGVAGGDAGTRPLAIDDGGASRRPRIGAEPVIRDGGDDPARQPALPDDRGGVPDAAAPGEPASALNVQQNEQPLPQESVPAAVAVEQSPVVMAAENTAPQVDIPLPPPAADAAPARAVAAAAAQTDPNPTPARAEAENYRTGKAGWNGLTLSVENAKGGTRRGTGPDGTEWSVEMPAHYGRILGTKGADGDHVDFYMGDDETSDFALIVNQIDPSTGSFDEHKVILGAKDRAEAMRIYEGGFSDGSGPRRVGSASEHTVDGIKAWLASGDLRKPTRPVRSVNPAPAAAPSSKASEAKPRTTKAQREREAHLDRLAEYFAPGNIVRTYGGGHDRVIGFDRGKDGDWSATVQAVSRKGDAWVDAPNERPRTHRTEPEARDMRAGPVGYLGRIGREHSDNDRPQAQAQEDAAPQPSTVPAPKAKIEDFGEKIGGAKKDLWTGYAQKLAESENYDLAKEPLSKTWPEPDYEGLIREGADPWSVAFVRSARDAVPRKPSSSWKARQWVEQVRVLRGMARQVLSGDYERAQIDDKMVGSASLQRLRNTISLYETFGHAKSLKGLVFRESKYSVYGGQRFPNGKSIWEITQEQKATAFSNMPRVLAKGDTREEAIDAFRPVHEAMSAAGETKDQAKADRRAKFIIWSLRGETPRTYIVGTKIGANHIPLRNDIADVAEARRIVAEEADQLQAQLDRLRDIPRERRETNEPRVGVDHRNGADVTPEMFQEAFGFRGVEFGNYVEGRRRQEDLNNAYDALMDLAGIIGVPSKALSLNGSLGLAFGARGSGGKNAAAAHFEPGKIVINLTKTQGRGALAHEWFHAVDNYFARQRQPMKGTYITDNATPGGASVPGIRPEVVDAFLGVRSAIAKTKLKERSGRIDKLRSSPYWGTGIEMHARAFESYVVAKLQDQSAANDYLANLVNGQMWGLKAEASGLGDSYPYLKPDEIEAVRPAFDALFRTIETRQTDSGVEMYSRATRGWGEVDADPEPTPEDMKAIARDVTAEMRQHGLDGKIKVEVVRDIHQRAFGVYTRTTGSIRVKAAFDLDTVGVLRHEIIHALRDSTLWGREHGLFSKLEWQGLVRAARADKALMERIEASYPDLRTAGKMEEAVAEMYRLWATRRDQRSGVDRAFQKVRAFFTAMANALRGRELQSAALTMERIASGRIGDRGPEGSTARDAALNRFGDEPAVAESRIAARRPDGRFSSRAAEYSAKLLGGGAITGAAERGIIGQMLTDAMGGRSSRYSILALVPGEPLYQELAQELGSARTYLRLKHDMSAMRNHMQAEAAKIMDQWRGFLSRNRKANDALMDLMHDATKVGLDPAAPFSTRKRRTRETQAEFDVFVAGRRIEYEALRARWDAMPDRAQEIYRKVRDAYVEVARTERDIIEQNISEAMAINLKRARQAYEDELTRIDEDGLEGDERMEAEEAAAEAYAAVKKRDGYGRASRLRELRQKLESNQVEAPYFPLLRHGQYFVTVKDSEGRLVSFTKAESEREQTRIADEARKEFAEGHEVVTGLMGAQEAAPDVDPLFVADVEKIIGQTINDPALMDAIWQRYLESLPDFSIRKSRLHRKGTPGYARDAFRNFARQMFHSAHQLARLKHGMKMQMALDDAEREAQRADDPNRAMAIVNEMGLRHDWIMNPKTAAWSTWATAAAFIYYLGVTPAAALVNLSQTVIVGIPVLAAAFKKGGALRASRHLMRGLKEFGTGRGAVENAKTLTDDERAAIREAYDRGIVDKSQAHDLAGVAESGVEYSDIRQRVMAPIAFLFHHTERLNREITFIAAYRMARQDGLEHQQAIDKAGQLTWKTHFNYESDSRPRVQQDDFVRVLTVFRNFQLNMLYRLFRDTHQSFKGKTPEERQMARAQLFGITGLMMLSAGVTGTWGYSLMMTLAGMITPGADSDDLEKELRNGLVNMLGADLAGMILKGVPGHLSGIDLTNRLGMPDLWFRSPDRQLEGDDLYTYWAQQFLGAVPGMAQNLFRGVDLAAGGDPWRGVETAAPKFIRDLMRGWRYSQDGVTTISGNTILERVPPLDALTQALGFTPAQIAERYEQNRWMMNENVQIQNARSSVLTAVWQDVRDGGPISARTMEQIETFNTDNPDYPIDAATIRRSVQSRRRGATETLGGVRLNNRIEARIRANAPVSIYGAAP